MGYDVTRFQGDVDEDLICPICSGVLEEPVQVSRVDGRFGEATDGSGANQKTFLGNGANGEATVEAPTPHTPDTRRLEVWGKGAGVVTPGTGPSRVCVEADTAEVQLVPNFFGGEVFML